MSRKVTMSLESVQRVSAEKQPLRVAAYCRVSIKHKEQQHRVMSRVMRKIVYRLWLDEVSWQ